MKIFKEISKANDKLNYEKLVNYNQEKDSRRKLDTYLIDIFVNSPSSVDECGAACNTASNMPTGTNLSSCILSITATQPGAWYGISMQVNRMTSKLLLHPFITELKYSGLLSLKKPVIFISYISKSRLVKQHLLHFCNFNLISIFQNIFISFLISKVYIFVQNTILIFSSFKRLKLNDE